MFIPEAFLEKLSTRTRNLLTRQNILTREILLNLNEKELCEIPNVGMKTIREIQFLQKSLAPVELTEENFYVDGDQPVVSTEEIYAEFDSIINACLRHFVSKERSCEVLKRRFGLYDGKRWTLGGAGEFGSLTRQRVNQLEKVFFEKWARPENAIWKNKLLAPFLESVYNLLTESGGIMNAVDLTEKMASKWSWSVVPPADALARFMEMASDFRVCNLPETYVFLPVYPCLKCAATRRKMTDVIGRFPTGFGKVKEVLDSVCEACHKDSSCNRNPRPDFQEHYVRFLGSNDPGVHIEGDMVCSQQTWVLKNSKSRLDVIEMALLQAGGRFILKS